MKALPTDRHITYQHDYRKCGKADCKRCATSKGHGPYWYAFYRVDGKLKSHYIGKHLPNGVTPPKNAQG